MSRPKRPELLAPAGDLEKLKYAFAYGADAVYCGLPAFSLRAKTGFDFKSLKQGLDYAHGLGKKVYVTVNIFAHQKQIKILPRHLSQLKVLGPDAVILSDAGILLLVKKIMPQTPLFISTQANVLNAEAVKFWQGQGVTRIILGREAGLQDLADIHRQAPNMELEVFVHGAMCLSYSGRCYLSAWLQDRSANAGLCVQPCRFDYQIYLAEKNKPGELLPLAEDDKGTYLLNSKDLCLINYLPQLTKAGACSFKIEGRTKSLYYLATVIRAYRLALNNPADKKILRQAREELDKVDHRGYTTGFLFKDNDAKKQNYLSAKAKSAWQFVGQVTEVEAATGGNKLYLKAHNVLRAGEPAELLTPADCYRIKIKELANQQGQKISQAHGGTQEIFSLLVDKKLVVAPGALLRQKAK